MAEDKNSNSKISPKLPECKLGGSGNNTRVNPQPHTHVGAWAFWKGLERSFAKCLHLGDATSDGEASKGFIPTAPHHYGAVGKKNSSCAGVENLFKLNKDTRTEAMVAMVKPAAALYETNNTESDPRTSSYHNYTIVSVDHKH